MDGFKQRIIGAVIIVSLAVIFLPMLFDEPHEDRQRQSLEIPEEPDFPEVRVDEPREPQFSEPDDPVEPPTADVEPPEDMAQSDDEPEPAPESEEGAADDEVAALEQQPAPQERSDAPDSSALEGAYLVQLGSFGSAENARGLRDRVREEGMEAYTETISRDDQTLTRVYAGPFLDKADAESAKDTLDEVFGLQTLVISGGD